MMVTNEQLCIAAQQHSLLVDHVGLQDVGAVGTSNLHPEPLVLKGDVLGTKLDMGDFENCGSMIFLV